MSGMGFPNSSALERWPWPVRGMLGCLAAGLAVVLTDAIVPLRGVPLLVAFPTVILSTWYLGMWGGVLCALTDAALVDSFLTKTKFHLSFGYTGEELRLSVFLGTSILLSFVVRRLADQRTQFSLRDLQQRLDLANVERQLAEERAHASETLRDRNDTLQLALHANNMGLWAWDIKPGTIHWSDEVYRILGHEPGSIEPSFATWSKLIHPEDVDIVTQAAAQTNNGRDEFDTQYRVIWPDGSVHWLESRGRYHRDVEGNTTRVVGVLTDVSNRKRAEEAMLRAEKLAVAGRLVTSIAHEINNPLETVMNLLYLITLAEIPEAVQEQAQQALEELKRAALITQQTLSFHRQSGQSKIVKLSELFQRVLTLFRGKLMTAQIAAELRTEREESIECIPGEIQQIFSNLLSNAIDAMPPNGRLVARLRPSLDWRDGKTAGMRVTVCDSGTGMDRATMQRIFEPFFTTKTETGTGLGMWVVAQLVERHQGHLRVWSTRRTGGSGTAFSLYLPLRSPALSSLAEPPKRQPKE